MKTVIMSLLIGAILIPAGYAQIHLGPEVGLNVSQLTYTDGYGFLGSTAPKPGLIIGGIADITLTRHFFLQPGLYYAMTGCEFTDGGSINLNTLEVPLMIVYKFGNVDGGRFFISLGPYVALNVSGTYKGGYYGSSSSVRIGSAAQDSLGNGDDIKAIDFGLANDAGYQFANGVFIRARSLYGLTNLHPPSFYGETIYSSAFSLTVGCIIGAGGRSSNAANKRFYRR